MREIDPCDVVDAVAEAMCKGCPKEKECDGVDSLYFGMDGGNNMQMIICLTKRAGLIKDCKPPERLEAERYMVRCPVSVCKEIIDIDNLDGDIDRKLQHAGDSVTVSCPKCGSKLKITVSKDLYLDVVEEVEQ